MTTSKVVPFPAVSLVVAGGGGGGGGAGGGVVGTGVAALGARKSTLLATAAAPSSEETITLHLPVMPGVTFETSNANVVFAPLETTTEEGAESGFGESTGVEGVVKKVEEVEFAEHAPPRASVAQQAPATAERDPVAFPAFLRVTKTGPPPAPGAHDDENDDDEEEAGLELEETLATSAAAVPCSSPATSAAAETLTLTASTCAPSGLYLQATHCTTSAVAGGGDASASAEAALPKKEQLPPVSAEPAATVDDGASGGRKSANWSAAVVAFGAAPAARPTAVQLPGTYPPLRPHLGATQLAHPEASIPKMLAVGAVEAAVPPAASR